MASLGIENVRIRSASSADKPAVDNRGDAENPRFHVVGILTASEELRLPGGKFHSSDRQRLADYFARLSADGPESMTAERGRFGLTEKEFTAAHADLAQPVEFATKGQPLRSCSNDCKPSSRSNSNPTPPARSSARQSRSPTKSIILLPAPDWQSFCAATVSHCDRKRKWGSQSCWESYLSTPPATPGPSVGNPNLRPAKPPRRCLEFLNVEIEGYTLQEAVDAVAPRIKLPLFWDHAALAKDKIDPTKIQVHLPRSRTYYKRILDRVLAQAHLNGTVRVDEAGTAFLWISK